MNWNRFFLVGTGSDGEVFVSVLPELDVASDVFSLESGAVFGAASAPSDFVSAGLSGFNELSFTCSTEIALPPVSG